MPGSAFSPDAVSPDPGGLAAPRESVLKEVFELQMGMLWLAQQAMRDLLTRFELQPPHLMILHLLGGRNPELVTPHQGGLSMKDFVRSMDIPPASATAMIDRMIGQGLVERGPSEQDRRVVMVRLAPRGESVLGEVMARWQQVQRDAFTVLSDEELTSHLALMRRLQEGYLQRFPGAAGLPDAFCTPGTVKQPAASGPVADQAAAHPSSAQEPS